MPPTIHATPAAVAALQGALTGADVLHLAISDAHVYDLFIGPPEPGEIAVEVGPLRLHLDPRSIERADGLRIDFVDGPAGGFKLDSPHRPPTIRQLTAPELARMLREDPSVRVFDVRTETEWQIARIDGAIFLDDDGEALLRGLPKQTPIVFQCHHGIRSQHAAQRFLREGFTSLFNLAGGIDAWSRLVDPNVPRY